MQGHVPRVVGRVKVETENVAPLLLQCRAHETHSIEWIVWPQSSFGAGTACGSVKPAVHCVMGSVVETKHGPAAQVIFHGKKKLNIAAPDSESRLITL